MESRTYVTDKVALVTGAGSGIGRACAASFARAGAAVIVTDVNEAGGTETVEQIAAAGGDTTFVACDVTQSGDVAHLLSATIRTYGRLDFACNSAGIAGTGAPTADYPEEMWHRVIGINLTGVWLCMKHEIPAILASGGGAIVNIASILGTVGFANAAAYTAAKHGVIGLTKVAALDYATQGLRVNAICPGFIATPMLEGAGMTEGSAMQARIAALHPMQRLGTPDEIASAVLWLCSDAATFITGHAMVVDGGYIAQ